MGCDNTTGSEMSVVDSADSSTFLAPGIVRIISNGETYLPHENAIWTYQDGLAADMERLLPQDVADLLTPVPYSDDFRIAIVGEGHSEPRYWLYIQDATAWKEVYYNSYSFDKLTEAGEYILRIELSWGNDDQNVGFQYFFKLDKLADTPLSAEDVPPLPVLSYAAMDDNEWELKRLRLSRQGFEVLDERGRISWQDGSFSLSGASDSSRRDVEKRSEYMEEAMWSRLRDIFKAKSGNTVLGFLEYYGAYYLVTSANQGYELYSLGSNPVFVGGMSFDEFCEKAWEFFCFVENYPDTIYGGTGLGTPKIGP